MMSIVTSGNLRRGSSVRKHTLSQSPHLSNGCTHFYTPSHSYAEACTNTAAPRFVSPDMCPHTCRESKRSKGIAYVLFQIPEDAVKAHAELDMTIFQVGGRDGRGGRGGRGGKGGGG